MTTDNNSAAGAMPRTVFRTGVSDWPRALVWSGAVAMLLLLAPMPIALLLPATSGVAFGLSLLGAGGMVWVLCTGCVVRGRIVLGPPGGWKQTIERSKRPLGFWFVMCFYYCLGLIPAMFGWTNLQAALNH